VDIWLTFAPSTTNHSPSKSVSDKKKVMDRVNEGKDGGASEWESASSLYKACLDTLNELCDHYLQRKEVSVGNKYRITEIEARLRRFDEEPLDKGILDDCLKGDKDLHDHVINLLRLLGNTLLRGMSMIISPSFHPVSRSLS
jgi:hypothetical protein